MSLTETRVGGWYRVRLASDTGHKAYARCLDGRQGSSKDQALRPCDGSRTVCLTQKVANLLNISIFVIPLGIIP